MILCMPLDLVFHLLFFLLDQDGEVTIPLSDSNQENKDNDMKSMHEIDLF